MGFVTRLIIAVIVIFLMFFRLTKPIFKFLYKGIIKLLTTSGMSENLARTVISLVGFAILLSWIF